MDIIDTLIDIDSINNHMLDCGHFAGVFTSQCKTQPVGTDDWGYEFDWAFVNCTECGQTEIRAY